VFIPETKPQDPSNTRLLILDSHGSHTTDEFIWECFNENIFMIFMPPHSSHVLQPLDLGVFSALNRARAGASRQIVATRPTTPEPIAKPITGQIRTPTSRHDSLELQKVIHNSPGTRLAFQKMAKVLDMKDIELMLGREKICGLELQLEQLRATKRRKTVTKDPNERFVNIQQIMKAREESKASLEPEEVLEQVVESEEQEQVILRRSGRTRIPTKRALEADDEYEVL